MDDNTILVHMEWADKVYISGNLYFPTVRNMNIMVPT